MVNLYQLFNTVIFGCGETEEIAESLQLNK